MLVETPRLILRPPRLSDAPALFAFMGDADAMKFTQVVPTLRDCRRKVAVFERGRRRLGFAPWTVVERPSGRIVGWSGLLEDPFDPGWGIELAYFFHRDVWGIGYATEAAEAAGDFADNVLRLPHVDAFARPENVGSRRVLEKAGFRVVRWVPEMERHLYRRPRGGGNPTADVAY